MGVKVANEVSEVDAVRQEKDAENENCLVIDVKLEPPAKPRQAF